jgi:hypothetical protein
METRLKTQRAQKTQTKRRVELRMSRKKAIESLDFERAEELEHELHVQKANEVRATFDEIKPEFVAELQAAIERSRAFEAEIQERSVRGVQSVRRSYHRLFTDIQQIHLAELAQLESQYADNRIRANGRRIPEQTALLEEAKKAALNGDYATAREKRDRSRVVAQ